MTTKIPVELSSTPGIVDGSNATAITIDSSENVTLTGNLVLGDSDEIQLGASADIIFKHHTSGYGHLENKTGTFYIDSETFTIRTDVDDLANAITIDAAQAVAMGGALTVSGGNPAVTINNSGDAKINLVRSSNNISYSMTTSSSGGHGFYDNATSAYDLYMKAGRIGIGVTSPDVLLEIAGAHTSSIGMLHLDSSDHAFIALDAASSSHDKGIYFQEAGTAQVIIDHDGSANQLRIHDGSNTHMVIQDGGNVGIGDTAPSAIRLSVVTPTANHIGLQVENSNTADSFGMVVKGGNDANDYTADFRKRDNTNIMRIRGDGNVGIGTNNTSPASPLHVAGNMQVNTTVTDSNEARFKVVPGGSGDNCTVQVIQDDASTVGVYLQADGASWFTGGINPGSGDTTAANVLDDYEEGTWTPTVSNFTGTSTSHTATGTYTKIGRCFYFDIEVTSNGGTTTWGTSCLIGLPIAGVNNGGMATWRMPAERNTTAAAEHMVPIDMSDLGNARFFIQNGFEGLESGEKFVISGFYRVS